MPAARITSLYNKNLADITILDNYINGCSTFNARYQYMIGEVVMLRLFSLLEITISETAYRLACGATYRNGNRPIVLRPCRSIQDAYATMLTHNRVQPIRYLQWTKANFVKDSIQHVLDSADSFYVKVQRNGAAINDMRIVRNHVAHRSTSTKREYTNLLRRMYGGNPNLTIGAFLMSTARNPRSNISSYIQQARVIIDEITNG